MVFLCTDILHKVTAYLPNLAPGAWPLFFDSAIRRFKKLKSKICCIESPEGFVNLKGQPCGRIWVFRQDCMDLGEESESPVIMPDDVLIKASMFAYNWKLSVNDAIEKLGILKISYEFLPERSLAVAPASTGAASSAVMPLGNKIIIKRSVAQLAVFIRGLYRMGVFDHKNKSELFRIISTFIRTEKQEVISPKSLKNCFDCPPPEAIEFVKVECHRIVQEIVMGVANVMIVMGVMA